MTTALIENDRIVAAGPGFLERLGLTSLDELGARGGLEMLAPGWRAAAGRLSLTMPAAEPAEAELVSLAGNGRALALLQLVPGAPGADWPFLARLSHEVRTPLTSVIGFAELMGAESLGPLGHESYRGYVADILTSARHALSLVDDLLDAARFRAGRIALAPVHLDPLILCREAVAAMQPRALDAGVSLGLQMSGAAVELLADRRSLKQILLNLLANALAWTPRGGSVTVLLRREPGDGLAIELSDTGPGMSAEALQASLVDPFAASRAQRPAGGGSGLGLPLSRELATANGASLVFDTSPGHGMRVTLHFPKDKLREINGS